MQREKSAGYTQAFSSFGGLLVGAANVLAARLALDLPMIHGNHEAWRYTLISGVIPALPLILIRPFLPESPVWAEKKATGTLRRPRISELFSPALVRTTVVTTLVFAASYGIAFGAIQQLPQILGGPKGHAAILATSKAAQDQVVAAAQAAGKTWAPDARRLRQIGGNATDGGGGPGDAVAGNRRSRRPLSAGDPRGPDDQPPHPVPLLPDSGAHLRSSIVLVDLRITHPGGQPPDDQDGDFRRRTPERRAVQLLGELHPPVFPVHLRGTGESFAANIGGRVLGTAAAWFTLTFSKAVPPDPVKIALVGAAVAGTYALVGVSPTGFPNPRRSRRTHSPGRVKVGSGRYGGDQ